MEEKRFLNWRVIVLRWAAQILRTYGYGSMAERIEYVALAINEQPRDGGGFRFVIPNQYSDGLGLGNRVHQALDRDGYPNGPTPEAIAFVLPLVTEEREVVTTTKAVSVDFDRA